MKEPDPTTLGELADRLEAEIRESEKYAERAALSYETAELVVRMLRAAEERHEGA